MYVLKECTKCKEAKLLDEFRFDLKSSFGRYNQCRKCVYDYFKRHKEKNIQSYRNKWTIDSLKTSNRLKNDCKFKKEKTEYNKLYKRSRTITDIDFRNRCNIRGLIKSAIKRRGYKKTSKTFDILGCDYETFKSYFESLFKPGMTWENHGEWHIDHIYPVSKAKDEQHLIELNHYTNLQPLWASENFTKGNKIITK